MAKLIVSQEDASVGHLHAVVGVLNLIQYIYRYCLLLNGDLQVGFGRDISLDVFSLVLMSLPNVTAFIFQKHVPVENKGDNVTIWKEYRWHNLIFVLQSILLLSTCVYQMHFGPMMQDQRQHQRLLLAGKVTLIAVRFVCMALATHYNPPVYTSTIRGAYKDAPAIVRFGLSYAQFAGTSIILCWDINPVLHFIVVSGLQLNSFCMTLRKKGKIGTTLFLSVYVFLVMNMVLFGFLPPFRERPITTIFFDDRFKPFYMGLFTFFIRRQGINRFATWVIGPMTTELVYRGAVSFFGVNK